MIQRPGSRRQFDVDLLIQQFNRRVTGWVLGTGLLAFHAGVFFLTMTGLIFWNVYRNPNDLWTIDLLKRWGAVLILHGVVTVAATVGWRLLKTADIQEARQDHWPMAARHAPVIDGAWRALESGGGEPRPYVPASELEPPKLTAAQRLRSRAASRVATFRGKNQEVSPTAAASWPEPPVRRDADADDLIRRFGAGDGATAEPDSGDSKRPANARRAWIEAAATRWVTKKETTDGPAPERAPRVAQPAPPPAGPRDDEDDPFAL